MKIIGVDPGSTRVGFGVIEYTSEKSTYIESGILKINEKTSHKKLVEIYNHFSKLLEQYQPDYVGIESLWFLKNAKTAVDVLEARGVLLLCATQKHIPIIDIKPLEVKQGICGDGKADKKAVEYMVKKLLHVDKKHTYDDEYDALAIAIVCGGTALFSLHLAKYEKI